jgi:two-component system nitrogen regulation sensor histidine kinase NtrY
MIDLSRIKSLVLFLSGALILVLAGFLVEKAALQRTNFDKQAEKFQETLHRKEDILKSCVERILDGTDSLCGGGYLVDHPAFIEGLNRKGLAILIYEEDTLMVWTDHTFPIPLLYNDSLFQKGLVFQGNTWFRPLLFEKGNGIVIGLIRLKHEYTYENKFLKNGYERGFNMLPTVTLTDPEAQMGTIIYDQSGKALFSLDPGDKPYRKFPGYLISGFYFAGLIFILLFFSKCLAMLPGQREKRIAILGLGVLLILINFSLVLFRVPAVVFTSELFSPYYFANSRLLGSLGNFFITSVFILFFIIVFSREFSVSGRFSDKPRLARFIFILLAFLLAAIHFSITHYLFQKVLLN